MTLADVAGAYGASIIAFLVFGLLHSIGAQDPFKKALTRWTNQFFVDYFWRLTYCGLSYWALYYGIAALHWARNPEYDVWLFDYPDWLWIVILCLHLASVAMLYTAFLQSDYLEFLGLRQGYRGLQIILGQRSGTSNIKLFGTHRLEVRGVYGWVRHPMLVAGLCFLLTSGPSLSNIVYSLMYASYMVIGGYYEEKRMIRIFGNEYRDYQHRVGAFFPILRRGFAG